MTESPCSSYTLTRHQPGVIAMWTVWRRCGDQRLYRRTWQRLADQQVRGTLRRRARANIEQGPITSAYGADRERVVEVLNQALSTELVCVLRYKRHYLTATGLNAARPLLLSSYNTPPRNGSTQIS